MKSGIYIFTNLVSKKSYIGRSINIEKRIQEHKNECFNESRSRSYNGKFYRALRKYGFESFSISVLEECAPELQKEREIFWIKKMDTYENGYNGNLGGEDIIGFGENHENAKLTDKIVLEIKNTLKNTSASQYELANRFSVSQAEISNINNGKRWSHLGDFKYPIRVQEGPKGGSSHRAILSDEEVLKIRNRYVLESGKKIYSDYSERISYVSFEKALLGKTFSHLPIYKKKDKKWINQ